MRGTRLLYTLAAVVALAPLAAIAPASAAVQHPAAPQTTCTGGWPEVTVDGYNQGNAMTYIGSWYAAGNGVIYGESTGANHYCEVALTAPYYAFRVKGTSNCVAYIPSAGDAEVRGCDYSSANQQWRGVGAQFLTTKSSIRYCLDERANEPVFMNTCSAPPGNQVWLEHNV